MRKCSGISGAPFTTSQVRPGLNTTKCPPSPARSVTAATTLTTGSSAITSGSALEPTVSFPSTEWSTAGTARATRALEVLQQLELLPVERVVLVARARRRDGGAGEGPRAQARTAARVPDDVVPTRLAPKGSYGVAIDWSDGNRGSIYLTDALLRVARENAALASSPT